MMRSILKSIIPGPLWRQLGIARRKWIARDDAQKTTREVFSRIYASGLWGSGDKFSSGQGSCDQEIVGPYVGCIREWVLSNEGETLCAVDLGCGNFNVGSQVFPLFRRYIGIDIVPALIEAHRQNPAYRKVDFQCVDAIEEPLPDGDVIFVRQVMQHLSNEQILKILPKIQKFKHAIITEHIPAPARFRSKNADKLHGGSIRLTKGSGVYLDAPPFSLAPLETKVLLEVAGGSEPKRDGIIQTTYYRFR